jgi:hypothetical protein
LNGIDPIANKYRIYAMQSSTQDGEIRISDSGDVIIKVGDWTDMTPKGSVQNMDKVLINGIPQDTGATYQYGQLLYS